MQGEFDAMFKTISELVQRRRDQDLKEYGLTFSQARVLMYLYRHEGYSTQKQIQEELQNSHAAAHGLLSRMKEKKLLKVIEDSSDRRNRVVGLTTRGKEVGAELEEKLIESRPTGILDETDRKDLRRILKKIIEALSEDEKVL